MDYTRTRGSKEIVVANTLGALPASDNGSLAYVSGSGSLYLRTGGSWAAQSVGGGSVNSAPTVPANVFSQYTLATDGTPTVITLESTDADSDSLSWSSEVVEGTLGNTTVTNSGSQFTITPSTSSVDDGRVVLRFIVSDGTVSANTTAAFDLAIESGWNVSSASATHYSNAYISLSDAGYGSESSAGGIAWHPTGNTLYIVGWGDDHVDEFEVVEPWNLDTLRLRSETTLFADTTANNAANPSKIAFSSDGGNAYILSVAGEFGNQPQITQHTLTVPWLMSSHNTPPNWGPAYIGGQEASPSSVSFTDNGVRMFVMGISGDDLNQYELSTPWNPGTATYQRTKSGFGEATPEGHTWSPDGSNVYVVGRTGDSVQQFALSTPWEVNDINTTAVATLSVSSQETAPHAVRFKSDGTRVYVYGTSGDDINEYALSTPWDLSTATYSTTSSSLSATAPSSFFWKSDGTELYATGTNFNIDIYTLSSAWDISTLSFDRIWYPPYGAGSLYGIWFDPTGTWLYMIEQNNDKVWPYKLHTAWDLTSASTVEGRFIDDAGIDASLGQAGFAMEDDGTDFYAVDTNRDLLTQYSMSPSWNITAATTVGSWSTANYAADMRGCHVDSTKANVYINDDQKIWRVSMTEASNIQTAYLSQSFDLTSNVTTNSDLYVSPSGNVAFVADRGGSVYQLNMSTNSDLDTASWDDSFSINSQDNGQFTGMMWHPNGSKFWAIGTSNYRFYEYSLSTPWDISTASYSGNEYSVRYPQVPTTVYSPRWSDDGTKLYFIMNSTQICQYSLDTAYDLGTISASAMTDVYTTAISNSLVNLGFTNNGTRLQLATTTTTYQCELSTAWDVTTLTIPSLSYTPAAITASNEVGWARWWTDDYMYAATRSTYYRLQRYTMTDPGNGYSMSHPAVFGVTPQPDDLYDIHLTSNTFYGINNGNDELWQVGIRTLSGGITESSNYILERHELYNKFTSIVGLEFKPDGSKMFVIDDSQDRIFEFTLSTPWNVAEGMYVSDSFPITYSPVESTPTNATFSRDGKNVYVVGYATDTVTQFKTTTAWSINQLTSVAQFSVGSQEASPYSVKFKPDGTRMYILGNSGDDINEYSLSTAWDVSTASFVTSTSSLGTQDTNMKFMAFKDDGTRVYTRGTTTGDVFEYTLSTPWDVSTLSFSRSFDTGRAGIGSGGLALKTDGKKMYLLESEAGHARIIEYDVGA